MSKDIALSRSGGNPRTAQRAVPTLNGRACSYKGTALVES